MGKLSKIGLYVNTVKHLKPSQVLYRVWRKAGGDTCLKPFYVSSPDVSKADISAIPVLPELDFDPAFIGRFDVDAILNDKVELLHHEEQIDWSESWHAELATPLWRFNLHYCEYLLPLAKTYLDSGDSRYLDKAKFIVESWIENCPLERGGTAWDPYTISMRTVNWLAFYGELVEVLKGDSAFVERMSSSLAKQFTVLSKHLEVDLLANHYLEDLKALVLLSCYFDDGTTLDLALPKLYEQVDEQILPDGMHFELSPMYHKIVLEDLLRVATTLQRRGVEGIANKLRIQAMCDCLYSMERHANRTPLFNDSGDNVAKSRDALLKCAKERFGIEPTFYSVFPDAGYCVLERDTSAGYIKIVFDTGKPGPEYACGHAHCDMLSFEAFCDGEPFVVNCGTYAYQSTMRLGFKKTSAHNAPQVTGIEQSECWSAFRMAKMARCRLLSHNPGAASAVMVDCQGNRIARSVALDDEKILVNDETDGALNLTSWFHVNGELGCEHPDCATAMKSAPDFGETAEVICLEFKARGGIALSLARINDKTTIQEVHA